jgi:hypothetical protein
MFQLNLVDLKVLVLTKLRHVKAHQSLESHLHLIEVYVLRRTEVSTDRSYQFYILRDLFR